MTRQKSLHIFLGLAILLLGVGCQPKMLPPTNTPPPTAAPAEASKPSLVANAAPTTTAVPAANTDAVSSTTPHTYQGIRLAGTSAPLLNFTTADYQAALASDKLIVLYFYANWCPECRAEFPEMVDAFNQLATSAVIGFRVNFNDNETDEDERELARQYGVAYQHTKVLVKNKVRRLKAPDSWDQQKYLLEILEELR